MWKIAEKKSQVPVLLISASDMDIIRELDGLVIKITYLQKPFGVRQFWQVLNNLVGPCDRPPRLPGFI